MTVRHTQSRSKNNSRHPGVKKQLENVLESVRGLSTETKHMAAESVSQAHDSMDDYVQQGKKRAKAVEKSLEERIRADPMKALLVASGIGFLCGLVFRRS